MHRTVLVAAVMAAVAALGRGVSAQTASCTCPQPATQQNFDAQKYLGKWYEMRRVTRGFEKNGQCGTAEYSWIDTSNSAVNVTNTAFIPSMASNYVVNLLAKPTTIAEGKFEVTYPLMPKVPSSIYWVLETDYNTYSIVYSCSEATQQAIQKLPSITLWVLARDPANFDTRVQEKVRKVLTDRGFDDTELEVIRHDCPASGCKPCSKTKDSLDLTKLAGRWWEIQHSPFATGAGSLSCSFADLSATSEGLTIQGTAFKMADSSDQSLTIEGKWKDATKKSGEFSVTKGFNGDSNDRVCVVDTDYDNWAVLSVCAAKDSSMGEITKAPVGGVYVLSRKRGLLPDHQMEANKAVLSTGLAASSLESTPTTPCPKTAFNAAGLSAAATPAALLLALVAHRLAAP